MAARLPLVGEHISVTAGRLKGTEGRVEFSGRGAGAIGYRDEGGRLRWISARRLHHIEIMEAR